MKFEHQIAEGSFHTGPETEWLLFLLYNAKFWAKIAKDGHYPLIGARWEETLSRHVIEFDQWEHANIWRCTIMIAIHLPATLPAFL